jgi:hypothetical protein
MSHFTEVEVFYKQESEDELVAALEQEFGVGNVERHLKGSAPLYGWHGDDRSKCSTKDPNYAPPCDIIIRRKHVGGSANDVGFRRNKDGVGYTAYISEYDNSATFTTERQHNVSQDYSRRVILREVKAAGWASEAPVKNAKGEIEITVTLSGTGGKKGSGF